MLEMVVVETVKHHARMMVMISTWYTRGRHVDTTMLNCCLLFFKKSCQQKNHFDDDQKAFFSSFFHISCIAIAITERDAVIMDGMSCNAMERGDSVPLCGVYYMDDLLFASQLGLLQAASSSSSCQIVVSHPPHLIFPSSQASCLTSRLWTIATLIQLLKPLL